MAHRKAACERHDFATNLSRLGFEQIGDCTFTSGSIKIFRTNKTNQDSTRYWEIQEISTGNIFYKSNHTAEILDYLSGIQFMIRGATIKISAREI